MTTATGVTIEKPWYLSKKIWLCAIAMAVAVAQDAFGRWTNVTPAQIAAHVAEAATFLIPLLGTILSLAHVDAKTRAAALLADAISTAASLDDAAPAAQEPTATPS
jgi:hypothetical protein